MVNASKSQGDNNSVGSGVWLIGLPIYGHKGSNPFTLTLQKVAQLRE